MDIPNRKKFPPFSIGSENTLDRMAEKRGDSVWVEQRLADKNSRFLLLADLSLGVESNSDRSETRLRWLSTSDIQKLDMDLDDAILLGCDPDSP